MRGTCLGALFLVLGGPSIALAQGTGSETLPLQLDWKAPPECASESAILGELSRIAHVKPGRTVGRLTARGRIEKHGELYRLTLRTERSGERGERMLAAPECRALEREVTLVLALAFGEGVEVVGPEPATPGDTRASAPVTPVPETQTARAPPSAPPSPPSPPPSPPRKAPPEAEPSRGSRLPLGFFLGGGALVGAVPSPAPMGFAGVDAGSSRLWLSARVLLLGAVTQALPRDVTAKYSGAGLSLSACSSAPAAPFRFGGCAGVAAVELHGRSEGASESADGRPRWYAATASAIAQWPARGIIGLRLEGLLGVSLSTPRFVVEGLGEAYTVPRLTAGFTGSLVSGLLE